MDYQIKIFRQKAWFTLGCMYFLDKMDIPSKK